MKRLATLWSAVAALIALGGCISDDNWAPADASDATAAESSAPPPDYVLGSGDQIRIIVFGEPDLSGEFLVDGAGSVSLPLIGQVEATGLSSAQLQGSIEERLRAGYVVRPRVALEVIQYRPYYILGEVTAPGEYPFSEGLTVLQAIATAGGFTYRANRRQIVVTPDSSGVSQTVALSPEQSVAPGDTIVVRTRSF